MLVTPVQSNGRNANVELLLDAPPAEAFAYITDLQNIATWWPEHTVYRRVFGDGGPGSLYTWIYKTQWVPLPGFSVVLVRAPVERFAYYARSAGIWVRFDYGFRAEGTGTRVTFAMRSFLLPPPIPEAQLTQAFERLGDILARRTAAAA